MTMKELIKNHFGFARFPFEKDIPTRELFHSLDFKETTARLQAALEGEDLALVWGRPGCGKSTVVRAFFNNGIDDNRYVKAHIVVPAETFHPGHAFTIGDLEHACPNVSRATIRRVLNELRDQGQVECLGKGRSARWQKV